MHETLCENIGRAVSLLVPNAFSPFVVQMMEEEEEKKQKKDEEVLQKIWIVPAHEITGGLTRTSCNVRVCKDIVSRELVPDVVQDLILKWLSGRDYAMLMCTRRELKPSWNTLHQLHNIFHNHCRRQDLYMFPGPGLHQLLQLLREPSTLKWRHLNYRDVARFLNPIVDHGETEPLEIRDLDSQEAPLRQLLQTIMQAWTFIPIPSKIAFVASLHFHGGAHLVPYRHPRDGSRSGVRAKRPSGQRSNP
jgi:hypothetical protein